MIICYLPKLIEGALQDCCWTWDIEKLEFDLCSIFRLAAAQASAKVFMTLFMSICVCIRVLNSVVG